MGGALKAGYATANTDTGHENSKPDWAFGTDEAARQRIVDFGYRAVHEMTVKAKQLIEAYYGNAPKLAYFNGCSTGGRQAMTEAQRYPADFNGILAGSPAMNWSQQMVSHLWVGNATSGDGYIPAAKLPAIQAAAFSACDTLDGLKDGLITDPRKCKYDPSVLLCKGDDSPSCLTAKQIESLQKIYAPLDDPTGKRIYPGHVPGAESGWDRFLTGAAVGKGLQLDLGVVYMKYFVLEDPTWDFHTWDFAKDLPKVDSSWTREAIDSMNPDLGPFRDHGSKLIVYQGWGDDTVSPLNTLNYYKSVVTKLTGVGKGTDAYTMENAEFDKAADKTGSFFRLFMAPGMNHCGGGPGPNVFDGMASLTNWVENKQAPDKIIATHMANNMPDRTRPLCPFPQTAQYTGQGSIDDAANFVCKLPAAN
jgi:feruloyl esterase